jgi:hypothetical protein
MEIRGSQKEEMSNLWSHSREFSDPGALSDGLREKQFTKRVRTNQHPLRSPLKTLRFQEPAVVCAARHLAAFGQLWQINWLEVRETNPLRFEQFIEFYTRRSCGKVLVL